MTPKLAQRVLAVPHDTAEGGDSISAIVAAVKTVEKRMNWVERGVAVPMLREFRKAIEDGPGYEDATGARVMKIEGNLRYHARQVAFG